MKELALTSRQELFLSTVVQKDEVLSALIAPQIEKKIIDFNVLTKPVLDALNSCIILHQFDRASEYMKVLLNTDFFTQKEIASSLSNLASIYQLPSMSKASEEFLLKNLHVHDTFFISNLVASHAKTTSPNVASVAYKILKSRLTKQQKKVIRILEELSNLDIKRYIDPINIEKIVQCLPAYARANIHDKDYNEYFFKQVKTTKIIKENTSYTLDYYDFIQLINSSSVHQSSGVDFIFRNIINSPQIKLVIDECEVEGFSQLCSRNIKNCDYTNSFLRKFFEPIGTSEIVIDLLEYALKTPSHEVAKNFIICALEIEDRWSKKAYKDLNIIDMIKHFKELVNIKKGQKDFLTIMIDNYSGDKKLAQLEALEVKMGTKWSKNIEPAKKTIKI